MAHLQRALLWEFCGIQGFYPWLANCTPSVCADLRRREMLEEDAECLIRDGRGRRRIFREKA